MKIPYTHGGDIYSHPVRMDYSANINPLGLPEGVKRELEQCLRENVCAIYPDSGCRALKKALAAYHQVPEEWISCGNGAADLIFALTAAIRPKRGLLPAPSFLEYSQALSQWGCEIDFFPLEEEDGFDIDTVRLCQTLHEAQKKGRPYDILFLCNPNNPTGRSVSREDMVKIGKKCKALGTWLAADECFCDFLDHPAEHSLIPDLKELGHVIVLKAFTKIYAMAGLRLGYSLCPDPELNRRLEQVRQPWSVSGLAQRAGIAALREKDYLKETARLIGPERERMKGRLESFGFQVLSSQANYIFFRDRKNKGESSPVLYDHLLKEGVLIRSCANYPGLDPSFYRICVKTREANDQFLETMKEIITVTGGKNDGTADYDTRNHV